MTDKLIGNIKDLIAQWFYYKTDVETMLEDKINIADVPTKTSDLENDIPYGKESELNEIKLAIQRFGVTFDNNTGILTFKFPRFVEDTPTDTT